MHTSQILLTVALVAAGIVLYDVTRPGARTQPPAQVAPSSTRPALPVSPELTRDASMPLRTPPFDPSPLLERIRKLEQQVEAQALQLDRARAAAHAESVTLPDVSDADLQSLDRFEALAELSRQRARQRALAGRVDRLLLRFDPPLADRTRAHVVAAASEAHIQYKRVRAETGQGDGAPALADLAGSFRRELEHLLGARSTEPVVASLAQLVLPAAQTPGLGTPLPLDPNGD